METNILELQNRVNNIYNHLYANSFRKTPYGISIEVGKVLHTGMFIEEQTKSNVAFNFNAKEIKSLREDDATIKEFAERIRKTFFSMNKKWRFYDNQDKIELKEFDLVFTCIQLNNLPLSDTTKDVFGDTIEIIRGQWAKQVGGQFFTDSLVTKLAMTLLDFDPRKGDDLIDICSGTGGFLLAGLNHIEELLEADGCKQLEPELVALARQSLKGQEIDPDVCQIANSTLATRLGKHKNPFVVNKDSIDTSSFKDKSFICFDSHKCVASNPPFGTKITIKDYKILREFELAKQYSNKELLLFNDKFTPRSPDILFLEQNVKLLIPGEGRLSIVLPYQILSGPQTLFIRTWLIKNTIIESVIDLPSETFQPHTGTKTCLITLRRRETPLIDVAECENYDIFMSIPKWIGHDRRGNPVFKKMPDGKNSFEILTDFPDLTQAYKAYKSGDDPSNIHPESFVISSNEVLSNDFKQLNAQFYRPSKYEVNPLLKKTIKNWSFFPLGQLVKEIFYPIRFKRDYVDYFKGAVPFFGGADINQLITDTGKWINPHHPKIKDLSVHTNWLLITRSGSSGIVSIVPEAWDGFAMSEHIIRIVPNEKIISPFYLLSFLRSKYCQEIIAKGVFGSVIDEIDPSSLSSISVPIPTDKAKILQITNKSLSAEKARNEAIILSQSSLAELNSLFDESFSV